MYLIYIQKLELYIKYYLLIILSNVHCAVRIVPPNAKLAIISLVDYRDYIR